MNSRNVLHEARELKALKELLLVYPWWQAVAIQAIRIAPAIQEHVSYPGKWKVVLYDLALALLPVSLTLTLYVSSASEVSLANFEWTRPLASWATNATACDDECDAWRAVGVTFISHALLAGITLGLRWGAELHSYNRHLSWEKWVPYIGLVFLGIASGLTDTFPLRVELIATIALAVLIALFSQLILKLPEKFTEDTKHAPPHPHALEWLTCGIGVLVMIILLALAIILDRL